MTTDHRPTVRLLTIAEVAEILSVDVRHVRRLVYERRIPYVKWGHLLRFDPTEIELWIDESRRGPRMTPGERQVPSGASSTFGAGGTHDGEAGDAGALVDQLDPCVDALIVFGVEGEQVHPIRPIALRATRCVPRVSRIVCASDGLALSRSG